MKVDIWSDVRCPFCYIGKRKFEMALAQFPQKEAIEIEWHSFELDPDFETNTSLNVYDYLAERKGQSKEWSMQMHDHVSNTAKEVGLDYHFEKAVVAASFNAHRLLQLAKTKGKGDAMEEVLFKAYFTEGRNIDDGETLMELGMAVGIDKTEMAEMLASDIYTTEVRADEAIAANIGINGVPFFVLNNKYGVSGAQAPETFLGALNQAWTEYEKENPKIIMSAANGDACDMNGNCG